MRICCTFSLVVGAMLVGAMSTVIADDKSPSKVYPTALLNFDGRGTVARDLGTNVTELLFARLANAPSLYLVDRADLNKILEEQALNISGAVNPSQAMTIGRLTGAKLLITGSVVQADQQTHLLAKIIGVGTSRVVGASARGHSTDGLAPLVEKLAAAVLAVMKNRADELVAASDSRADRLEALKKRIAELGPRALPALTISVEERHFGMPPIQPVVAAELESVAKELGIKIVGQGLAATKADFVLSIRGDTAIGRRLGAMVTATATLELDVVDRKTGKAWFADRQSVVVIEVSEQVAGRLALKESSALLAERILPRLVQPSQK